MSGAPDVAPALRAAVARADVDVLADIDRAALGQVVGVEARRDDRRPQHVGLQAGKGRGQNDVVGAARDQHLLVAGVGHAFVGGDEFGAHVGEVAAERLRRPQRMAVADAAGQHDRTVEKCPTARTNTNGLSQPVWPPAPAVNSTSPSAPASIARSAWRMLATSASTSAPASCKRRQHRRRRADAGDDDFRPRAAAAPADPRCSRALERCTIRFGQIGAEAAPLRRSGAAAAVRCRQASRRAVRRCGNSRWETSRSRRCGRQPPRDRRRRPETSAPRSAAG